MHATTPKVSGSSFLVTIPWPLHERIMVQNSLLIWAIVGVINLVINLFIWLLKYLTATCRISIMSFEMITWYRILFPANFSRTSCIPYCAIMGYVSHYSNVETYNQLDIKRSGWINSPCYVNKITCFFISSVPTEWATFVLISKLRYFLFLN